MIVNAKGCAVTALACQSGRIKEQVFDASRPTFGYPSRYQREPLLPGRKRPLIGPRWDAMQYMNRRIFFLLSRAQAFAMLLRCPPSDLRANHDRWYRPFNACYHTALLIDLMLGLMLVQRSLMLSGTCQHFLMRVATT